MKAGPFTTIAGIGTPCPACGRPVAVHNVADLPNYKLAALQISYHYREWHPKSGELLPAVRAFIRNVDRAHAPFFLLNWLSPTVGEFELLARKKIAPAVSGMAIGPDMLQKALLVMQRDVPEEMEKTRHQPDAGGLPVSHEMLDQLVRWRGTVGVGWGVESLLSSLLVAVWTSFEAFAEDLWVACLNARPRLGLVALNAEVRPGDDERERERKAKVKFQVPAYEALQPGFDLHSRLGTLLRDKWDFARLNEAEDAYLKAFRDHAEEVKAIFGADHVRWLAQVRHAIVHNGGVADSEFRQYMKRHPVLGKVEADKPIPLDGELVTSLVGPVLAKAGDLLAFVDGWMNNHPT